MAMVVEAELGGGEGGGVRLGTVDFNSLPEDCIANVLSFTTPRDAGRLSLLSSTFRSAVESDVVWDRFLPSDFQSVISRFSLSKRFASKKDLYLSLSQKPLLIDGGKMSIGLDKVSGKTCYMLSARSLMIVWGDDRRYWGWTSLPEARFPEVAQLIAVCWLEIRGWIKTGMLAPETLYGAYLVFKPIAAGSNGFQTQPVEASVGIVGADTFTRTVYLNAPIAWMIRRQIVIRHRCHRARAVETQAQAQAPAPAPIDPDHTRKNLDPRHPRYRGDGWFETELGEFFNEGGEDKELEMGVYEVKNGHWKSGLVVQGIEIRPKPVNK